MDPPWKHEVPDSNIVTEVEPTAGFQRVDGPGLVEERLSPRWNRDRTGVLQDFLPGEQARANQCHELLWMVMLTLAARQRTNEAPAQHGH